MDLDPTKIMMLVLKIIIIIVTAIIFVTLFTSFVSQIKVDDLEKFSVRFHEDLMSSQLTSSKYVFDKTQLNRYTQNTDSREGNIELDFLRNCDYAYRVEVENLRTEEKWQFGYKPDYEDEKDNLDSNDNRNKEKVSYVAISDLDIDHQSEFYGNIDVARLTVIIYDTMLVRTTCAIEKAYSLKTTQTMRIRLPICQGPGLGCLYITKENNLACIKITALAVDECRLLDIPFESFRQTDFGIDPSPNRPEYALKFYPIKQGASATCQSVGSASIATKDDTVSTVLICPEAVR